MNELVKFHNKTYCPYCKQEKIELYSNKNNMLFYKQILSMDDNKLSKVLDNNILSYFRCMNCGKVYDIKWIKNKPYPLTYEIEKDIFLSTFFSNKAKS